MATARKILATVSAVVLAIAAFVTLAMQRPVVSGTFFVLTAVAIYVRETSPDDEAGG